MIAFSSQFNLLRNFIHFKILITPRYFGEISEPGEINHWFEVKFGIFSAVQSLPSQLVMFEDQIPSIGILWP